MWHLRHLWLDFWGVTNVGSVHWHLTNYPHSQMGVQQLKVKTSAFKRPRMLQNLDVSSSWLAQSKPLSTCLLRSWFVHFPVDSDWITRQQNESQPLIHYKTVCHFSPLKCVCPLRDLLCAKPGFRAGFMHFFQCRILYK